MKAILLEEPRRFKQIDMAEPGKPGHGEALVRVHRVGICGTDLHAYAGNQPFFTYPRVLGHELGVEVVEVGDGVTNVKAGDHCVVEPYMNCGKCIACRRGRGNCCMDTQVLGVHRDGGMRPYFILRADKLHTSDKLSYEQLALVETLAIGLHAVNRAEVQQGENVLIIGAGPIGLGVMQFAKLAGAKVIVLDLNAMRLDFCKKTIGVDHTVQAGPDALRTIEEITNGELPTVVFDCTGSPRSMCAAFEYVAHTGKLVYVGIVTADITFPDPLFHRREMTLYASRNALPHEFRHIIGLIESGRFDTTPWITHHSSFDELIEKFPSFTKPETGVIKAVLHV